MIFINKKILVIFILLNLTIIASFSSASKININLSNDFSFEESKLEHIEKIYYVDDNREQSWYNETNYKEIGAAIYNATGGSTIYVYSGIYNETIEIIRPLDIYGEDKNTTIIDGQSKGDVVSIFSDGTEFSGFTVKGSGDKILFYNTGIKVEADDVKIFDNIIKENVVGILVGKYFNVQIFNNEIINNKKKLFISAGIKLSTSENCIIKDNVIKNNGFSGGIHIYQSYENIIKNNTIEKNKGHGIYILLSSNNDILYNNIKRNIYGIYIYDSFNNNITKNNLILNLKQATFMVIQTKKYDNYWNSNYWNRPRLLPYFIKGSKIVDIPIIHKNLKIPLFDFDMYPAKNPN